MEEVDVVNNVPFNPNTEVQVADKDNITPIEAYNLVMGKRPVDLGMENLVQAFLLGIQPRITVGNYIPCEHRCDPYSEVYIAEYNHLHDEFSIASNIKSACAIHGVKAQTILDVLLRLQLKDEDGGSIPVVCVGAMRPLKVTGAVVTTLEAVYIACYHVLKEKVMRSALAAKSKPKK
jgi:hypothetical protein